MKLERLTANVFLLLLVGLIALLATRAVRLATNPEDLAGIDERKWFRSAGPVARAAETLGALRSSLPQGGEVWLSIPPEWDPAWWGWMARYHLPEQRIAGVLLQERAQGAPAGAWVVAVARDGKAVVRRMGPR